MMNLFSQARFRKTLSLLSCLMLVFSMLFMGINSTKAQVGTPATITCIPVQQISQTKTQLECRLRTDEIPYFLVSEVTFPFHVTQLIKVSSSYSAAIGLVYPAQLVENTIFIAALDWGDSAVDPRMQAIPFDSLSFMLETDQPMAELKTAFEDEGVTISLLSPNPADILQPFFQTLTVEDVLLFDGSLILESFTQYLSPGVLQFLRLGAACYEETPQTCLANIIKNL